MNLKNYTDNYDEATNKVSGDLRIDNCDAFTTLPDGLTVGGGLRIYNCDAFTTLPDGLTVGGDLWIYNCDKIKSKPIYKTLQNGDYVEGRYLYACFKDKTDRRFHLLHRQNKRPQCYHRRKILRALQRR